MNGFAQLSSLLYGGEEEVASLTIVLELSDEAFQKLQRVAENQGVTPAEWVEASVSREPLTVPALHFKSVAEALAPYSGSVDSSTHKPDPKYRSGFGDIVDEKMAKQRIQAS